MAIPENRKIPVIQITGLPLNDDKTIGLIAGDASIISHFIPTSGTTITFDAPRAYGSWLAPRTNFVLDLPVDLNTIPLYQRSLFFLESTPIPAILEDALIEWSGDAYNATAGFVNMLNVLYTREPSPTEYKIYVHNIAKEPSVSTADPDFIGFWTFDADPTNDVITDSTTYLNHGLSTSTTAFTRVAGIVGNQINATTNTGDLRFEIPHNASMDFSGGMTVMGWFTLDASGLGVDVGIIGKSPGSSTEGFNLFKNPANNIRFHFNQAQAAITSGGSRLVSTTALAAETPVHIAVTYDGTDQLRLLINGVVEQSGTYATPFNEGAGVLTIGGSSIALKTGNRLDQARLYRRGLSDAEVLAIYNAEVV